MRTITTDSQAAYIVSIDEDAGQVSVEDALEGGVWWAAPSAARDILAADDIEQAALDCMADSPMRGEWKA